MDFLAGLQENYNVTNQGADPRPHRADGGTGRRTGTSDNDSDVPPTHVAKRRRMTVPESSEQPQHAEVVKPTATPKKRGRPRKPTPRTPFVVSGTEAAGAMEIEVSDLYDDPAATQLQHEVRSARKQSPSRQPSPELDDETSDFRSSQIVIGTQQGPPRVEEDAIMEEFKGPQPMSEDAAASSLSAKNSAYEPSGSTFENTTRSLVCWSSLTRGESQRC